MLAEVTASQWGMVTSAQASMHGVTRLDLARLADSGHLTRLAHGVYMDSGTPGDQFDDLRAAWLSTDPKLMAEDRLRDRDNGVVAAGLSAARLHDIGDMWEGPHDFVAPVRRQSQRAEIRYRQRVLDPRDVTVTEGLPVMTLERTIADLVEAVGDLSLVGDALRDAWRKRNLNLGRLSELLDPLAARNGFKKDDGSALLSRLMEVAGINPTAVARRVAADSDLGTRVAAEYLNGISKNVLERLIMTPEMQKTLQSMQATIAANLQGILSPAMESMSSSLVKNPDFDELSKRISAQFTSGEALTAFSHALGKSLSDSIAFKPENSAVLREAQRAVSDA
ncbi:type IV toxin-antitoxin system AbiEi family antitoxin domain-containing protein [Nocardioides cavernaquae]|uniref:type IV toxin-antitoxin system AbiEi family antitoxin domain-containing protein n=1 Tax=Nocardioides cavernaquae TaxID=2321396 RepID=UPI00160088F1|nr:type IV toxin-antitoxin system AbiEi family antitoxin domain-containing protein [Nocardioides cavernaquae]